MRKKVSQILFLVTVFLSLVLILLGVWAYKSDTDSFPNKMWMYSFWRFPITERVFLTIPQVRKSLGFVYAGDDKYDFLNNHLYTQLQINVYIDKDIYSKQNSTFEFTLAKDIKEVVTQVINKENIVVIIKEISIESKEITNIKHEVSERPVKNLDVYIISYKKTPDKYSGYSGLSYNSSTILMFENPQLTNYFNRLKRKAVFAHELGHILGLKHITSNEECVMGPTIIDLEGEEGIQISRYMEHLVNQKTISEEAISQIMFPYRYCELELEKIERMRKTVILNMEEYPGAYYYLNELY